MNLIDINRQHSLSSLIESIKKNKSKLKVWQSIKETQDYSYGMIVNINTFTSTIKIRLNKKEVSEFDKNQDIYFHSPCREIIFKAQIKGTVENHIEVSLPVLIKIKEARTEKRTNLGIQSNQFVKALYLNEGNEKLETKLRVLDFSDHGLALLVNKFIYEGLTVGSKVAIRKLSLDGEAESKIYIVRNMGSVINKIGSSKEFRVGLEVCS